MPIGVVANGLVAPIVLLVPVVCALARPVTMPPAVDRAGELVVPVIVASVVLGPVVVANAPGTVVVPVVVGPEPVAPVEPVPVAVVPVGHPMHWSRLEWRLCPGWLTPWGRVHLLQRRQLHFGSMPRSQDCQAAQ